MRSIFPAVLEGNPAVLGFVAKSAFANFLNSENRIRSFPCCLPILLISSENSNESMDLTGEPSEYKSYRFFSLGFRGTNNLKPCSSRS